MSMIEVEVKARASRTEILQKLAQDEVLKRGTLRFIGTEHQKDAYFNAPDRDFGKTDEALRLRTINGACELTYKGKRLDGISKTRPEYNTPADEYNMTRILEALGFYLSGKVEKIRNVYRYSHEMYGDLIFCFDDVSGPGEFLEIEIGLDDNAEKAEIDQAADTIFDLMARLGLSKDDSVRTSYLELVMQTASEKIS